jgi:hypothetical protein
MQYIPMIMKTESVYQNPFIANSLYLILRQYQCWKISAEENFVVSDQNPEELGPLLQGRAGRALGNVNHQQMDPCARGNSPPSTTRSGTSTTTTSNPWHLLHAMRAMRISSQDPPTDPVDTVDIHLGGDPPGKENDSSFGVSRHLIHILIRRA